MKQELFDIFPFVEATMQSLEHQNKLLNKVTLTGKINALHVAATLFEFTDVTTVTFDSLQDELVAALLEENLHKLQSELHAKAKIAIDILIRNLFERTADVSFLATDSVIIDFLSHQDISIDTMRKRLLQYAGKYTVYNEIIIFDTEGNVKANMNLDNPITYSRDAILQEALQSNTYVERYAKTDIFPAQEKTLTYVHKIVANNLPIGVLCLCFRLKDELKRILGNLGTPNISVAIADHNGLIGSSTKALRNIPRFSEHEYQVIEQKKMAVTVKTNGYQGYKGISSWYGICVGGNEQTQPTQTQQTATNRILLNSQLKSIIEKADDLVEDLSDVIINGELIASKRRVYVLHPILDNLRLISTSLLETIKSSVSNLEQIVEAALINDTKTAAHLAIDIMDRNLYERANDCRWWALTPLFQSELAQKQPNTNAMSATLKQINDLYTVYTNLFIFDTQGNIVAASNDRSIIGERIEKPFMQKLLGNSNAQHYFVSDFEPCRFYNNRPTYVYSATITHQGRVVGGIGIVFDAEVEFDAMLKESFPSGKEGFALFVDANKRLIASSNKNITSLEALNLDDDFFKAQKHAKHTYITYNDKHYILSSAASKGYREYKTEDKYKNDVFALVFVALPQ